MLDRNSCPITASTRLTEKASAPYGSGLLGEWAAQRKQRERLAEQRYAILHNPAIDFYFQRAVFDQGEEVQRRQAIAERRAEVRLLGLSDLAHKAEDAMLVRLLHPDARPRVLDYGMGEGHWAVMARAYGAEVWGTDVDPRSERVAGESGVRFAADVAALEDGAFDFINADQVFEHLPDPLGVIRLLAAKLRSGGHCKISTPSDGGIEAKLARLNRGGYALETFKREFHALAPLSHINLFTAASLRALAAAAGLESFRVPLRTCYAVMTGFHSARQLNRNLYNPFKRHRARGTWQFFRKP